MCQRFQFFHQKNFIKLSNTNIFNVRILHNIFLTIPDENYFLPYSTNTPYARKNFLNVNIHPTLSHSFSLSLFPHLAGIFFFISLSFLNNSLGLSPAFSFSTLFLVPFHLKNSCVLSLSLSLLLSFCFFRRVVETEFILLDEQALSVSREIFPVPADPYLPLPPLLFILFFFLLPHETSAAELFLIYIPTHRELFFLLVLLRASGKESREAR